MVLDVYQPKENDEPVDLNKHSDEWISEQNDQDTAKKGCRASGFVPLEEEPERSLKANDKVKAAQEQDLEF